MPDESSSALVPPPAARFAATGSLVSSWWRTQWLQQKMRPLDSTPWPITAQPQCAHAGASIWMAHSKLSKICRCPSMITSKDLSYSFPQVSHFAIFHIPSCRHASGRWRERIDSQLFAYTTRSSPRCEVKNAAEVSQFAPSERAIFAMAPRWIAGMRLAGGTESATGLSRQETIL